MHRTDQAVLALVLLVAASASANLAAVTIDDVETEGPVEISTNRYGEAHGELVLYLLTLVGVGWTARALAPIDADS